MPAPSRVSALVSAGVDRRALPQWRQAKLRSLVAGQWGAPRASTEEFPGGAALADPARREAWVLIDDASPASLGPALAWALDHEADALHLLVDGPEPAARQEAAGILARRASLFRVRLGAWEVEGRSLRPAAPAPLPPERATPVELEAAAELLRDHGVDPLIEPDGLVGEVLGLEVARVVVGDDSSFPRLEVGIGRHDRMARREMRPDQTPGDALDEVAGVVRRRRRAGAPQHPANRLARERWLRAVVVARPELVGARRLTARGDLLSRRDWRAPRAAAAAGEALDGVPLVAACSVGVDLDLVPTAADHRVAAGARRLAIAVPAGDDYPVTRRLAGALADPADVVTVPRDWPRLLESPA